MNIDKLEAGPELDALIAEMMGLPVQNFSTDIAAAWIVVNEIIRRVGLGWFCLRNECDTKYKPSMSGYSCDFGDYGARAEAQTAPLAICRAALKAVWTIDKTT